MAVSVLALAGGVALVFLVLVDATATLVLTSGESAPWRPTRLWYEGTWRLTRAVAARAMRGRFADRFLQAYPALSLLGLLLLWLLGLTLG